jgi:23S rRNA (adenine1618-N6)-methyltransferase
MSEIAGMKAKPSKNLDKQPFEKNNLHPRNLHRYRYDFEDLVKTCPTLKPYIFVNKFGVESINFADPAAVKWLNTSILMHFYGIKNWDIPENYLVPPVPGRADYIHYIADLLAISNKGKIPTGSKVHILDIGVGANCIYPIIGIKEYGWHFVATDIDPTALKSAENITNSNQILNGNIEFQLQKSAGILEGIIRETDRFDAVICNPPFHASAEEAQEANRRKVQNLTEKSGEKSTEVNLNFGGHSSELWCEGGELAFVKLMVKESKNYKNQVLWFTSLVSNHNHLKSIENALKNAKVAKSKIIEMTQGQKVSRFIAWSFFNNSQHENWFKS